MTELRGVRPHDGSRLSYLGTKRALPELTSQSINLYSKSYLIKKYQILSFSRFSRLLHIHFWLDIVG